MLSTLLSSSIHQLSKSFLLPGVQEDEFEVQAGAEHEHVAVEFDLGDATGRKGVADCHQTHNLVTRVVQSHIHHVLTDLQVATAVDDLGKTPYKDSQQNRHSDKFKRHVST